MVEHASIFFILSLMVALFVGGTPALVTAIYFATTGHLDMKVLFTLSLMTTVAWDVVWYYVGYRMISLDRVRSWNLFKRNEALYERILALYGRHQYLLLFLSRFMYGTNSACSVVSGVYRMPLMRFLFINTASFVLTFMLMIGLSYGIHQNIGNLEYPYSVLTSLLILVGLILGMRLGLRRLFDRYFRS